MILVIGVEVLGIGKNLITSGSMKMEDSLSVVLSVGMECLEQKK